MDLAHVREADGAVGQLAVAAQYAEGDAGEDADDRDDDKQLDQCEGGRAGAGVHGTRSVRGEVHGIQPAKSRMRCRALADCSRSGARHN